MYSVVVKLAVITRPPPSSFAMAGSSAGASAAEVLDAIVEAAAGLVGGPQEEMTLAHLLRAYDNVLPAFGFTPSEDSFFYSHLLRWSLEADSCDAWRRMVRRDFGHTSAPATHLHPPPPPQLAAQAARESAAAGVSAAAQAALLASSFDESWAAQLDWERWRVSKRAYEDEDKRAQIIAQEHTQDWASGQGIETAGSADIAEAIAAAAAYAASNLPSPPPSPQSSPGARLAMDSVQPSFDAVSSITPPSHKNQSGLKAASASSTPACLAQCGPRLPERRRSAAHRSGGRHSHPGSLRSPDVRQRSDFLRAGEGTRRRDLAAMSRRPADLKMGARGQSCFAQPTPLKDGPSVHNSPWSDSRVHNIHQRDVPGRHDAMCRPHTPLDLPAQSQPFATAVGRHPTRAWVSRSSDGAVSDAMHRHPSEASCTNRAALSGSNDTSEYFGSPIGMCSTCCAPRAPQTRTQALSAKQDADVRWDSRTAACATCTQSDQPKEGRDSNWVGSSTHATAVHGCVIRQQAEKFAPPRGHDMSELDDLVLPLGGDDPTVDLSVLHQPMLRRGQVGLDENNDACDADLSGVADQLGGLQIQVCSPEFETMPINIGANGVNAGRDGPACAFSVHGQEAAVARGTRSVETGEESDLSFPRSTQGQYETCFFEAGAAVTQPTDHQRLWPGSIAVSPLRDSPLSSAAAPDLTPSMRSPESIRTAQYQASSPDLGPSTTRHRGPIASVGGSFEGGSAHTESRNGRSVTDSPRPQEARSLSMCASFKANKVSPSPIQSAFDVHPFMAKMPEAQAKMVGVRHAQRSPNAVGHSKMREGSACCTTKSSSTGLRRSSPQPTRARSTEKARAGPSNYEAVQWITTLEDASAYAELSLLRRIFSAWAPVSARLATARARGFAQRTKRFLLLYGQWKDEARRARVAVDAIVILADRRLRRVLHRLHAYAHGLAWSLRRDATPCSTRSSGVISLASHIPAARDSSGSCPANSHAASSVGSLAGTMLPPKAIEDMWREHLRRRTLRAWRKAGAAMADRAMAAAGAARAAAGFRLRWLLMKWAREAAESQFVKTQRESWGWRRGLDALWRSMQYVFHLQSLEDIALHHFWKRKMAAFQARTAEAAAAQQRRETACAHAAIVSFRRLAVAATSVRVDRALHHQMMTTAHEAWRQKTLTHVFRASGELAGALETARAERELRDAAAAECMRRYKRRRCMAQWLESALLIRDARDADVAAAAHREKAACLVRLTRGWSAWCAHVAIRTRWASIISHQRLVSTRLRRAVRDRRRALSLWGTRTLALPTARARWWPVIVRRLLGVAVHRWVQETAFLAAALRAGRAADRRTKQHHLARLAEVSAVLSTLRKAEAAVAARHSAMRRLHSFNAWVQAAVEWLGLAPIAAQATRLLCTLSLRKALVMWQREWRSVANASHACTYWRMCAIRSACITWRSSADGVRQQKATAAAGRAWSERWCRHRLLRRVSYAWYRHVQMVQAVRAFRARGDGGFARVLLHAWHTYTRKRGALRRALMNTSDAARRSRAAQHMRAWRRGMAATVAARRLAMCWLEALAIICWRELRSNALRAREEREGEWAAIERACRHLRASVPLHAACHYAIARWKLLPGAAALSTWKFEVRKRHVLRLQLDKFALQRAGNLASRVFRGWAEAVWYEQLMRRCREEIQSEDNERADGLIDCIPVLPAASTHMGLCDSVINSPVGATSSWMAQQDTCY